MKKRIARPTAQRLSGLIGKVVVGEYPAANYRGVRRRFERRRVLVEEVRLIEAEPLDAETLELEPLLRRGPVLITGRDLDKDAERSFYLSSFRSWRRVSVAAALRMGPNSSTVAIIPRPKLWEPESVEAVPPGVTFHPQANSRLAAVFANRFNSLEMSEPTGRWALRLVG